MQYEPDTGVRRPTWLLPGLVGLVALLAVMAGLLLAVVLRSEGTTAGAATPSPTPSSPSTPSLIGTPSAAPDRSTPSQTQVVEPIIPNRAIAEVATDKLNLRQGPGEDTAVRSALTAGRLLFIIGQPREAGDLRWYRVGTLSDDGCGAACSDVGWVATPLAGDRWVEPVAVECPPSPLDVATTGLHPLEMLHCYGSNEIQLIGTVQTPCCGGISPYRYRPAWLADPFTPAFLMSPHDFGFRHDPSVVLEVPERGDVVRVTGHLEDRAAPDCRVSVDPDWESGPVEPLAPEAQALLVLACRSTFVWTAYEVIGREELGPCC